MDAGSLTLVHRLINLGRRSLLQYVSDSSPFTTEQTCAARAKIFAAAVEEREAVTRLQRYLQKNHIRPILGGSYPAHFTQFNFITIDCLLPKLVAENELEVAEIEKGLAATDHADARALAEPYLEMKRRHLQILKELSALTGV